MVEAAQAINAHHAGNGIEGWKAIAPISWDLMTSPEAVSAMLRQAWIEAASELVSAGVGTQNHGIFTSQAERKAMFDSIRIERKQARELMDMTRKGDKLRAQLESVIRHQDQVSADIYKMDNFGKRLTSGAASVPIADATDKMATLLMGKEAKGDEY
jgi:hypothetical protein